MPLLTLISQLNVTLFNDINYTVAATGSFVTWRPTGGQSRGSVEEGYDAQRTNNPRLALTARRGDARRSE